MPSGFMVSPVYCENVSAGHSGTKGGETDKFIVFEVGDKFFGKGCGTLFKGFDPVGVDVCEFCLDRLHVALGARVNTVWEEAQWRPTLRYPRNDFLSNEVL
jgi:hypothetical protein